MFFYEGEGQIEFCLFVVVIDVFEMQFGQVERSGNCFLLDEYCLEQWGVCWCVFYLQVVQDVFEWCILVFEGIKYGVVCCGQVIGECSCGGNLCVQYQGVGEEVQCMFEFVVVVIGDYCVYCYVVLVGQVIEYGGQCGQYDYVWVVVVVIVECGELLVQVCFEVDWIGCIV